MAEGEIEIKRWSFKDFLILTFLVLVYFGAGKLGLSLAFFQQSASPVWPPTGIAVAGLLLLGKRFWPGIFLGAFWVNITTTADLFSTLGIAAGNTLEAFLAVYFIDKFTEGKNIFSKPASVFRYLFLVGGIATAVSATFGVGSLLLARLIEFSDIFIIWITWWLGDLGGAVILAPVIILWARNPKFTKIWTRFGELIFLLLLLLAISGVIFGGATPIALEYPLAFILIPVPVLIWMAFRFGPKETATSLLILAFIATLGTISGFGPFMSSDPNRSLILTQVFLGTLFLAVMPLTAAVAEQEDVYRALGSSEEKYRLLVETSPDPIVIIDLKGNVQFANKQMVILYGFKRVGEIVGKSGFDFVAPEDIEKAQKILTGVVKKGRLTNVEYTSVKKDGTRFVTLANAALLVDQKGRPSGIMGIIRDITSQKRVEKLKTEFVSLASHQLRTPLGNIRWNVEMLMKGNYGKMPDKAGGVFESMYGSVKKMILLVNDLLSVSRIDENRLFDNPKGVDVKSSLVKTIKELVYLAKKKEVSVNLVVKRNPPKVRIDPGKLTEVFQNLLSNAIRYNNKKGRVDVLVEAKKSVIKISFKDTGIGIPDADKGKIFTKFFRSEVAARTESEGTGLGLFVVKSYIEGWGGKVYFTSREWQGSTFTIEIPLTPKLQVQKDEENK